MGKFGRILKELLKVNYKDIKSKTNKKKIISDVSKSVKNYQATSDDYEIQYVHRKYLKAEQK